MQIIKFFLAIIIFFASSTAHAEVLQITLNDAIKFALENNRSIEQSKEDRESSKWNLSAVRRSFGSRLSWSSSLNRIGGRYYASRRANRYQASFFGYDEKEFPLYQSENYNTINFSFPLYTGGNLEGQIESANYNLNSADLILENTRQQVKWQVAQAYFQVLQMNNLIKIRQEEIELLQEHLKTVQTQFEVGVVAMSDVLATNVQLANSQQAMNTALGNHENAVANLNNLIGFPVGTEIIAKEDLKYFIYGKSEENCLEYALSHRPDGIAANFEIKKSEAAIKSAKSGFRPNISAVVQGSFSGEGVFKADHDAERWSAGLQMSWNIFDNNVTSAQVHQANSQQKKAESVALQQIEKIRLEVHTAYTNLKIAEKNIAVTSESVKKAEEQYEIAKVRYEEGVDINLTVMNAQEKLTQARTNYFSALYSYNEAVAQLEKAMGVPIEIDAKIYSDAISDGKNFSQALNEAKVEK